MSSAMGDPNSPYRAGFVEIINELRAAIQPIQQLSNAIQQEAAGPQFDDVQAAGLFRHELRNPLGAIKGFSEMIEEDVDDETVLPLAQQLVAKVDTILDRITDVTTLASET
tara:strand:+ start:676 stop:1008 length:333 start_codon:yes stop_codon:yes gene_type:complete